MSMCDTCMSPGHCCQQVFLSGRGLDEPMSYEQAEHAALKNELPFVPGAQREDGRWVWACYHVQADGRCAIYETRPQLCRDYAPGTDRLCVHYWAKETVDG